MAITPQDFWEKYRESFRATCRLSEYKGVKSTTAPAILAATRVMRELGLTPTQEYFHIDLIGENVTPNGESHNWRLRVAFEHENDQHYNCCWVDEICKLDHVVADLCIVASYWKYTKKNQVDLQKHLQGIIDARKDLIRRVPERKWLFIFGPNSAASKEKFVAFQLDDQLNVVPCRDNNKLVPMDDLMDE